MFNESNRGRYCGQKIADLKERIYTKVCDLKMTAYRTPEPVPWAERESGERQEVAIGESWGRLFDCAWFHMEGRLPGTVRGKRVVLVLDISGEGLVYDAAGQPYRAITNVRSDSDRRFGMPGKRIVPLYESAVGGEKIDLWMDAGCNDLLGNWWDNGSLKEAHAAVCDESLRQAYYDLEVLMRLFQITPETEPRHYELLDLLFTTLTGMPEDPGRQADYIRERLAPFYSRHTGDQSMRIIATGHAHLDLAWLWPLRETRRKAAAPMRPPWT